jgi:hypothetical protein
MATDTALPPWYHKRFRGGQAVVGLSVTLASSLTAVREFQSAHSAQGWLFIGIALLVVGYASFNLIRWLPMKRSGVSFRRRALEQHLFDPKKPEG